MKKGYFPKKRIVNPYSQSAIYWKARKRGLNHNQARGDAAIYGGHPWHAKKAGYQLIIGISGPERSGKDCLGAVIATHPEFKYPINEGYGNMHLFKTPYPWHYMRTAELLRFMQEMIKAKRKNVLVYISEADKFLNARGFKNFAQTDSLTGIWQGEKSEDVFLYNWHPGDPEEPMTGVDLLLRSSTSIKIRIDKYLREGQTTIHFKKKNVMMGEKTWRRGSLRDIAQYYGYWNHKEIIE